MVDQLQLDDALCELSKLQSSVSEMAPKLQAAVDERMGKQQALECADRKRNPPHGLRKL